MTTPLRPIKPNAMWKHPLAVALYLLVFTWVVIPLLPEGNGFRFGLLYRVFFTIMILWGTLFFFLLRRERINPPATPSGILLSILGVYVGAIAFPLVMGVIYPRPQLAIPTSGEEAAAATPGEKGRQLFFGEGMETVQPHCALCHKYDGKGGTRGPALDDIAADAAKRKPGTDPKEYVREHILKGSAYFVVPGYDAMMPGYEGRISEEQIDALINFLFGEGGEAAESGQAGASEAPKEPEEPKATAEPKAAERAAPAKAGAAPAKEVTVAAGDVVRIELKDYEFAPVDVKVKAKNGEVQFLWNNTSTHAHNYRILDKSGKIVYPGPKVGAKKKREETLKLAPGEYEVICNLSDHEERGMKGTLIVEP